MISFRTVLCLFLFLFFSNILYAESRHLDCRCTYKYVKEDDYILNDTIKDLAVSINPNQKWLNTEEETDVCQDMHLEIDPNAKEMRIIEAVEPDFVNYQITDSSFFYENKSDNQNSIWRFDRYTGIFIIESRIFAFQNIKELFSKKVYRCEEMEKKF